MYTELQYLLITILETKYPLHSYRILYYDIIFDVCN